MVEEFIRIGRFPSTKVWSGEIPGEPQCGCAVEILSRCPLDYFLLTMFRTGFYPPERGEVMYRTFKECALEENSLEEC